MVFFDFLRIHQICLTEKGKLTLKKVGKREFEKSIAIAALKTKKIKQAAKYFFEHPKCTRKELGEALSVLTSNIKSEIYRKQVNYAPPASATVRDDLYHLKRMGLIELKGRGRGANWILVTPGE